MLTHNNPNPTGNGTEEILTAQRASSFQFISLHAANIFPHTGAADPGRHPHVVNIPIEAPLTPAKYRKAWAQVDAASIQTQAQLVELWQVKQPSVSQTLQQLIEAGAVEALPRRGREAIQYLMTGTARLAL